MPLVIQGYCNIIPRPVPMLNYIVDEIKHVSVYGEPYKKNVYISYAAILIFNDIADNIVTIQKPCMVFKSWLLFLRNIIFSIF